MNRYRHRLVVGLLVFIGSSLALFAQPGGVPTVVSKSLLQELSAPAIFPLWVCSALIVYLVIDLYMKTASGQFVSPLHVEAFRGYFKAGDYRGAFVWARQNPGTFSRVIYAGLKHAPGGKQAAEDAMSSAIVAENARFQSKIAYLSVIGVIAPMIGLTGTVIGMIQAFAAMGQAGAADPSKLSGAIGHVLHATASGLAVAIPAFVFYYLIRNRVGHSVHALSDAVNDLFRKFPYAYLARVEFEGGESFAATPDWVEGGPTYASTLQAPQQT